eukprot:TRINITY_DN43747_c0_g1_i2.p2 TRINITY_DN43747_c0_g1~~TRINITY_DN43747_c0_g1_i2.p2  ORF type:complete len:100 (-),score=15.86 TRINITY_DN43747_c0_g1_i2:129-428(-)
MTGKNGNIVGKRKKLFADAAEKRFVVATGQIGTADAVAEKHITSDQKLVGGGIETHAGGGMSRGQDHAQGVGTQRKRISLMQNMNGSVVVLERHTPAFA